MVNSDTTKIRIAYMSDRSNETKKKINFEKNLKDFQVIQT